MAKILPEIVPIILANLGKADLLNCRLVSFTWNQECLKVLKKSNFCIRLDENDLGKFVEFAQSSINPEAPFAPLFHLDFDLPNQTFCTKMELLTVELEVLMSLFGSTCVRNLSLQCCSESPSDFLILAKFLSKICGGLETLDLKESTFRETISLEIARQILKTEAVKLPNIKKFKCKKSNCYAIENYHPIYCPLLEISPNLQELSFRHYFGYCYSSIPFQVLTSLTIDCARPMELLAAIRSRPSLTQIKKLTFGTRNYLDKAAPTAILSSFSHSLKSLKIFPIYHFNQPDRWLFPFPRLPVLERFTIGSICTANYKINISLCGINFNPHFFPALKSVDIPSNCNLTGTSTEKVVLPSVQNLNIRVMNCNEEYSNLPISPVHCSYTPDGAMNENLKALRTIFPNAQNISIQNICNYGKPHATLVLTAANGRPRIERIAVLDCDQFYLESLLNKLDYSNYCPQIILKKFPRNLSLEIELRNIIKIYVSNSKLSNLKLNNKY